MFLSADLAPSEVRCALLRALLPASAVAMLDEGLPETYVTVLYPLAPFTTQQLLLIWLAQDFTRTTVGASELLAWLRAEWITRGLSERALWDLPIKLETPQLRSWMIEDALCPETVETVDGEINKIRSVIRALALWIVVDDADLEPKHLEALAAAAHFWVDFTNLDAPHEALILL